MDLPVENIVSEVDLKPNDILLPLYEAVVNAIISLKQSENVKDKKIQIQITRGELPQNSDLFNNERTIQSIKVIDNGEGFTSLNLKSYKTAYSRKNKDFGCKGIGRFTILAAFEKIEVFSQYLENGKWNKIEFEFDPINEVKIISQEESTEEKLKTVVHLTNLYNESIKDYSAKSVEQIADELMNHCLIYYLCGDLPRIEIIDDDKENASIVNEWYDKLSKEREREFSVGQEDFKCYITKTEKTNNRKNHYSYYCANSRVVGGGRSLSRINSLFIYPITSNGSSYFLDVYLVLL